MHAVEFPVPVVDFTVGPDGAVWTLLDAEWTEAQPAPSDKPQFVRLLSWNGGVVSNNLCDVLHIADSTVQLSESTAPDSPLLNALNTKCLVAGTFGPQSILIPF